MSKADLAAALVEETIRVVQQNAELEGNVHPVWKGEEPAEVSDFRMAEIQTPPTHVDLLGRIRDGEANERSKLCEDREDLGR